MTITRRFAVAALAAPLALAACSAEPDVDERVVSTDPDDAVDVRLPTTPVEYPEVPLDARNSLAYEGTYVQSAEDGRDRRITLDANDGYTIRDETGIERTGTFNWYADNSRVLIRDEGQNRIFAIADGVLYELPDETTPIDAEMNETQTWRRVGR